MLAPAGNFGSIAPLARKAGERSDLAVADGVTKLLVRSAADAPLAVVLCASPKAPKLVARGLQRAREAKALLGPELGRVILDPLGEGEVLGLSFAVLPYCQPLATSRLMWAWERRRLRPAVLEWLQRATAKTSAKVPSERVVSDFVQPLHSLADDREVDDAMRHSAMQALTRLESGLWSPRHALMHNDFWQGNILIDHRGLTGRNGLPWARRFVIIDWPGAAIEGYGMCDLLRFARAVSLSAGALREEALSHCRILECDPVDAHSHLMSGLAYLAMHLEHFPKPAFVRTALMSLHVLTRIGLSTSAHRIETRKAPIRTGAAA